MLICNDQRNGEGCGYENPDGATHCKHCGLPLRFAVQLHDPGSRVGRYRVVRVIGYGTFGAVYESTDAEDPGRRVALKQTFNAAALRGFQHEFAALAGLRHPSLPTYYDLFTDDGSGYLVMEFVPGQSLEEIAQRQRGPLSEQVLIPYAEQICDLLSYLHSRHPPILHRDIKPANIRVTPEGLAKLVDFGLLKQGVQRTRQSIHGLGTLEYMPLEQFDWSGGTDQRSDIYSLGATLYQMLTGQWPLSAPKRMSKAQDPLRPPHKLNRQISPHVSAAIMRAMSRFPQDRYPSAEAFKRDLEGRVQRYLRGARIGPIFKGHAGFVYAVAWSPDGQQIASGGDRRVLIWHAADGARLHALSGHTDEVRCVAWGPDGKLLASAGNDRTVRIWAAGDGQPLRVLTGHTDTIAGLAWHLDGELLASAGHDGSIRLWSVGDGALVSEIRSPDRSRVHSIAWRPDGQILAAAYHDGAVRLWHVAEPLSVHTLPGHDGAVFSVAWSPDGQTLASGGADTTVRLWRLAKGRLVNEIQKQKNWAAQLAWSPIGRVAGYADQPEGDDPVWLWRIADGSLCSVLAGHHNHVYSVAWSPDGQALASAGADTSIRLWREDGTPISLLTGHTDWVYGLAWDPAGRHLASASLDGHVQLWELE